MPRGRSSFQSLLPDIEFSLWFLPGLSILCALPKTYFHIVQYLLYAELTQLDVLTLHLFLCQHDHHRRKDDFI